MQEERQEGTKENRKGKRKPRSRRITADFMRIEDAGTMPGLTPFELETRKKIAAQSTTPRDVLAAKEEEGEKRTAFKSGKRKIRMLIREGALTRRQRLVYELCYVSKLRESEVAELLDISCVTVRRIRLKIKEALARGFRRKRKKQAAISRAAFFKMTRRQKQIFTLHYHQALEPKEIAAKMGLTERNVYYILKRIQKKIFQE